MSTWFLKKLEAEGLHSIQCIMRHIAAKSNPDTIKMSRFFKKEKLKNKDTCNISSAFMCFSSIHKFGNSENGNKY